MARLSKRPGTRMRRPSQTAFAFRTWGGKRPNAGRKPRAENVGLLPHAARPRFDANVPMHVTLRGVKKMPNLRSGLLAPIVREEIARASAEGLRVLHYSIQTNHIHLIVEATSAMTLSRGMQRLGSRVARRVNLAAGRRGRVWRERYHREDLTTPRQVRNALVYVLFNTRKHATEEHRHHMLRRGELDPCSSAAWFDGWLASPTRLARIAATRAGPCPVVAPETFLARRGWLRHGRIRIDEAPRSTA